MTISCLEGIDYSGKSTAVNMLVNKFNLTHYTLMIPPDEKKAINDLPILQRFEKYLSLNQGLFSQIAAKHTSADNILMERFWLSTIAYHNILKNTRFEEDKQIYEILSTMKPDKILFITTNKEAIEERMIIRPPAHKYERDVENLLRVQDEYLRIIEKINRDMKIPYSIIDNSTNHIEDLQKRIDTLTLK